MVQSGVPGRVLFTARPGFDPSRPPRLATEVLARFLSNLGLRASGRGGGAGRAVPVVAGNFTLIAEGCRSLSTERWWRCDARQMYPSVQSMLFFLDRNRMVCGGFYTSILVPHNRFVYGVRDDQRQWNVCVG